MKGFKLKNLKHTHLEGLEHVFVGSAVKIYCFSFFCYLWDWILQCDWFIHRKSNKKKLSLTMSLVLLGDRVVFLRKIFAAFWCHTIKSRRPTWNWSWKRFKQRMPPLQRKFRLDVTKFLRLKIGFLQLLMSGRWEKNHWKLIEKCSRTLEGLLNRVPFTQEVHSNLTHAYTTQLLCTYVCEFTHGHTGYDSFP